MKKIIFFLFVFFISFNFIYSQSLPGKEIRNREIEWTDFSGKIDQTSPWDAVTNWTTLYSFAAPNFEGDKARVTITVRLFLKSDSWTKPNKQTPRLLEHERGHFNIGRICADEIESTINTMSFDRNNYHKQIDEVYWKIIEKYKEINAQYERETDHYKNIEQQKKWNKKLNSLLK
ncbi:MAG: DUF922 domain-containing Zn-dependent protease [Pyrinomonadaceae bacterium]|nr:DUF922 domain-containing Zn-dependent protease [Pyrinomonadaceae bacterium]